ncbi:hypothetical protein IMZ11_41980 [Microtetraspora sp. AC03309]|uniref:hypothetical protein n=1 Tax=Microtetraspora sp. AC03309 TaxID=2779376 RepID=UPI001E31E0D3|nr:hypothetical protein [Microtetraspora sp. AC03309]MCC5582180.1 hypothetical protein [Microtetraspora sp. AC03309]
MSTAIPAPEPNPDEISRGLAAIEQHLAALAPTAPVAPLAQVAPPAPAELVDDEDEDEQTPAEVPADVDEGETKRVRTMRARVAEAHRLVELQEDEAPLLVDTSKVRKRRGKVAEAARLYALSQDPNALAWQDARVRRISTAMSMSAATIALGVSSIGVQASVAKGLKLDHGTVGWWAAYGVEPILSLPLLAAVAVQAYAAMRGRPVDRKSPEGRKLLKTEALLLGLTLVLNCWPAIQWSGFDALPLIVHALGPIGAVTAIWLLPTLWSVLAALPVPARTGGRTGGSISANAATATPEEYSADRVQYTPNKIETLAAKVRQMIAAGELPADPGIQKIRAALGIGAEVATKVKNALGGVA